MAGPEGALPRAGLARHASRAPPLVLCGIPADEPLGDAPASTCSYW
jgi:hypothetical protein